MNQLEKVTHSKRFSVKMFWDIKMTYKTITLQQLKESALKTPEVRRCYDNETLTIDDVEIIEVAMDDVKTIEMK
jgi:uncharacterized protein YqfB (UPF0267 family)